jgi:uroporphyrinogen decarboxylase
MYAEPAAWKRLMDKLVTVQADYLLQQARSGAAALQVFDSWAGLALGKEAYHRYVAPYNAALFEKLEPAGVPVINFSTGTFPYLEEVAACGGEAIGVDFRMPLGEAWEKIGYERAIQGNLDPSALLAPWRELQHQVDRVLEEAAQRPGHIFNLGHGLHKETPVDNVRRLVDYVHEKSADRFR